MKPVLRIILSIIQLFFFLNNADGQQNVTHDPWECIDQLGSKNEQGNKCEIAIIGAIYKKGIKFTDNILQKLEASKSTNHFFNARRFYIMAQGGYWNSQNPEKAIEQCQQAIDEAYNTGDDVFIVHISFQCGILLGTYQQIEQSIIYLLKADEIISRLDKQPDYTSILWFALGEAFFHSKQYAKCIDYIQRAFNNFPDKEKALSGYGIRYLNTLGQAYKQMGDLDSALYYYNQSMYYVNKGDEPIWRSINNVFIAEVFCMRNEPAKAERLIKDGYKITYSAEPNVSAYSLNILAKSELKLNNNDSALKHIRGAINLINSSVEYPIQKMAYKESIYQTAADIFYALKNTDSFYYYNHQYAELHDSLEKIAILSNVKMAQLRIDNEKNYQAVKTLEKEKGTEELKRNFIIILILLLSIISFFYVNRLRLKHRYKEELSLQQKIAAEAEIAAARDQLTLFKTSIIEKTNFIEKLEKEIQSKEQNNDKQQLIEELMQTTILTEDEWQRFKTIFEKIHPGFFARLKEKSPDITLAEQRTAVLTRLELNSKQIASMLGISIDSVRKARLRLRQRLGVEENLDEVLASL